MTCNFQVMFRIIKRLADVLCDRRCAIFVHVKHIFTTGESDCPNSFGLISLFVCMCLCVVCYVRVTKGAKVLLKVGDTKLKVHV